MQVLSALASGIKDFVVFEGAVVHAVSSDALCGWIYSLSCSDEFGDPLTEVASRVSERLLFPSEISNCSGLWHPYGFPWKRMHFRQIRTHWCALQLIFWVSLYTCQHSPEKKNSCLGHVDSTSERKNSKKRPRQSNPSSYLVPNKRTFIQISERLKIDLKGEVQ